MYFRFSCNIHSRFPSIAMNYTEQIQKCLFVNWYLLVAYIFVFSSPEPKAPGGAYSIGRLRRPSVHNFK